MAHPGAGAMGKHKARASLRRPIEKRGDRTRLPDLDVKFLRAGDFHLIQPVFAAWPARARPAAEGL